MTRKTKQLFMIIVLISFLILLSSCAKKEVSIGFVGSLSTKNSQLSIDARNAIELAVEEANAKGGIKSHIIKLVIKDDHGEPDKALIAHEAFKKENVALVIGHMTSNMAEALKRSADEDLLFLSPTMGAHSLTGIDDYFIRTSPLVNQQALLFEAFLSAKGYKNVAIIRDLMNAEYSVTLSDLILEGRGSFGKTDVFSFDSRVDKLHDLYASWGGFHTYDVVLMVSQAIDTAVLTQLIREDSPDTTLASVSWSMTEDLIINGGRAVENMYFIGIYKSEEKSECYLSFEEAYFKRYNYPPSFVSVMAYDAFYTLKTAMEVSSTFKPIDVKAALVNLENIQGLEEVFSLDSFGDNDRGYLMFQLKQGQFIPLYAF